MELGLKLYTNGHFIACSFITSGNCEMQHRLTALPATTNNYAIFMKVAQIGIYHDAFEMILQMSNNL